MWDANSYYELLGVHRGSSKEEIQNAYRVRSLALHPDRGGSADEFKRIEEAASILLDDEKRARLDANGFYRPEPTVEEIWDLLGRMFVDECGSVDTDPGSLISRSLYGTAGLNVMQSIRSRIEKQSDEHRANSKILEKRVRRWEKIREAFRRQNRGMEDSECFRRIVSIVDDQIAECQSMAAVARYKIEFCNLAKKQLEGIEFSKVFRDEVHIGIDWARGAS